MDHTEPKREGDISRSDWIFGHDPSPFAQSDPNANKPMKALWGLGLLVAISLAFYGFHAMHHADAAHGSPSNAIMHAYNSHLAPSEDHSLQD